MSQGLGLGTEACDVLRSFGLEEQLDAVSMPLTIDINRAVRPDGTVKVLSRDDHYNHRRHAGPPLLIPSAGHCQKSPPTYACQPVPRVLLPGFQAHACMQMLCNLDCCPACSLHWSDLHQMLLKALPGGIMHFGTTVTAVEQPEGSDRVHVRAERKKPGQPDGAEKEHVTAEADLVIAADGQMSDTRRKFVPADERRHALAHLTLAAFPPGYLPPATSASICKPFACCAS